MALSRAQKIALINQTEKAEGYPLGSLVQVIIFETAGTFSTSIKNAAGSGAVGLIQFMPSTCRDLGYTTEQVAAMSFEQQLRLVVRYFEKNGFKQKVKASQDPLDMYLAVLYPVLIGKADTAIMARKPTKVYEQNKSLDRNKDGTITKGDIRSYFFKSVNSYIAKNNLEDVVAKLPIIADDDLPVILLAMAVFLNFIYV